MHVFLSACGLTTAVSFHENVSNSYAIRTQEDLENPKKVMMQLNHMIKTRTTFLFQQLYEISRIINQPWSLKGKMRLSEDEMINSDGLLDSYSSLALTAAEFITVVIHEFQNTIQRLCTSVHAWRTYTMVNRIISKLLPTLCRVLFTTYIHRTLNALVCSCYTRKTLSPLHKNIPGNASYSIGTGSQNVAKKFWPHDAGNQMTRRWHYCIVIYCPWLFRMLPHTPMKIFCNLGISCSPLADRVQFSTGS